MPHFEHLFTPLDLGPLKLRNRIFVTPHATNFASDARDNLPGETLAYYCAERAKGGVALIEVSMGIVSPENSSSSSSSSLSTANTAAHFDHMSLANPMALTGRWPINASDPNVVKGYSQLARAVHEHGSKCVIELSAGGTNYGRFEGVSSWPYPSTTSVYTKPNFTPKEMDERSIERIVEGYGKAAKYVKESGLDGVDLQASTGVLISEFLSAAMNRRTDRYGGSLENRTRLLAEIVQRIREYVGDESAVGMRLVGDEKIKGGNTLEDTVEIAKRFDGKLDWITADRGVAPQNEDWHAPPMYVESGYNLDITSPIKQALRTTKVGVVGRYLDPLYAEGLIANGLADMVAMTRALIADPELPNKAREGRWDEIRPCIGALQDCYGRMQRGLPISCTVNPIVSREKEWGVGSLKQAPVKKKVLIIGGGIAGLEAARIASERGHTVVVYERSRELGGQALLAAKLPGRENLRAIVTWLAQQARTQDVMVKYGMDVSGAPEVVQYILDEERPDAVIIATGSRPVRTGFQPYDFMEIPGWDQPNVCTDVEAVDLGVTSGQNVIIADSLGFIEAPGVAELLAKQGNSVEVVTPHLHLGLELRLLNHWEHVLRRLYAVKVKVSPHTWIKKIDGESVILQNVVYRQEERRVDDVDRVVLITGKMQNDSLYGAFAGKVDELHLAGDANLGGGRIGNAMYDGQRIAREL